MYVNSQVCGQVCEQNKAENRGGDGSENCQKIELNCFISDLVSSFIQNTNKEFLKVGQYTMIRLIKL